MKILSEIISTSVILLFVLLILLPLIIINILIIAVCVFLFDSSLELLTLLIVGLILSDIFIVYFKIYENKLNHI